MRNTFVGALFGAGIALILAGLTTSPVGGMVGEIRLVAIGGASLLFSLLLGLWRVMFPKHIVRHLNEFLEGGSALLQRAYKEDHKPLIPEVNAWTTEVKEYLRKNCDPRFEALFMNHTAIPLMATQYDNPVTLLLHRCIVRLTEFISQSPAD